MRIAFYVLSAVIIIGMAIGLAYLVMSQMNRHRGFQRSAAVVQVLPASPFEQARTWYRRA